jgi:hypothetical protein
MHDELHQFTRNDVWTLVPHPAEQNIIGTKWIFKNKRDSMALWFGIKPVLLPRDTLR